MKVKVLKEFRDKTNRKRMFLVGEEVDFEFSRAEDIVSRGLAEKVITAVPKKPRAKK